MKPAKRKFIKMKKKRDDYYAKITFRMFAIVVMLITFIIIPDLISGGLFGYIDTTFTLLCGNDIEECIKHDNERRQKNVLVLGSIIGIYTIIFSQILTNLFEIITYKNKSENVKKYNNMLKIVISLCTIYLLLYSFNYSSGKADIFLPFLNEIFNWIFDVFYIGFSLHTIWLLYKGNRLFK